MGNPLIESGISVSHAHESTDVVTKDLYKMAFDRGIIYFFIGYLLYADKIGNKRLTAFCRQFDPVSRTFTVVDSEEHESAD
jgi:hypothetical protein